MVANVYEVMDSGNEYISISHVSQRFRLALLTGRFARLAEIIDVYENSVN